VTWTGGAYLFGDVDRQPTVAKLIPTRARTNLDPTVTGSSVAAYGDGRVLLGRRLSLATGLRFSRDRKTIANQGGAASDGVPISSFDYDDTLSSRAWTPRVGLDLAFDSRTMMYVSAARGFKSGGFNPTAATAGRSFAPEWAWSYEAGLKRSAASNRAMLNVAAYLTDYRNLQVQTPIRPGLIDITNAANATVRGVEIETGTRLANAWNLGGHVAWLDATYSQYLAPGPAGSVVDVAGRRLANAPEWSARIWVERATTVGNSHVIQWRLDGQAQSTVFFTPLNDAIQRQQPYALLGATATLRPSHGRWSVGFYGRNLTNSDFITGSSSSPPPAVGGRPGEPRQFGLQLTFGSS
jgi:iron complex outermembrane receptor protein